MSLSNELTRDRASDGHLEQTGHASPELEPRFERSRCRDHLPVALTMQLENLALAEQTTLFIVLLTAFQVLVGRYEASDEVIVGARADRAASSSGMLSYRATLAGNPTFRALIASAAAAASDRGRRFRFSFALIDGSDCPAADGLDLAMEVKPRAGGTST